MFVIVLTNTISFVSCQVDCDVPFWTKKSAFQGIMRTDLAHRSAVVGLRTDVVGTKWSNFNHGWWWNWDLEAISRIVRKGILP